MSITADFRDALSPAYVEALRSIIESYPSMTAADLQVLLADYPKLGELTLGELLGESTAKVDVRPRTGRTARIRFRQPHVGRRLLELRKQAGLTRLALSDATGVPTTAIVRVEAGSNVRLSTYLPLIEYFIAHQPQAWMVADRIALLDARSHADLAASLDALGTARARRR
jgi:DNA-binding XRE family transcriptional regulator